MVIRMIFNAKSNGFTILELMIAIAIIAIISSIGFPIYQGYVETSRLGVLANNIATIRPFQEDFFLRNGTYSADANAIGWDPRSDDINYVIVVANDGQSYQVTATDTEKHSLCRDLPSGQDC